MDDFRDGFDVGYFRKHFCEELAVCYRNLIRSNPFAIEMDPFLADRRIPLLTKLRAWRIVVKKAILKALSLGRTVDTFSPN